MGSHTLTAPVRVFSWTARLLELVFLALLITFVAYLSKDKTAAPLAVYGGLSTCFNCDNGWNWHVLLMGIAFGIAMTESLLTFCSSSLRYDSNPFPPNLPFLSSLPRLAGLLVFLRRVRERQEDAPG
ncbi:unnamed protein product, partial [Closterium sp. Yama58-4]